MVKLKLIGLLIIDSDNSQLWEIRTNNKWFMASGSQSLSIVAINKQQYVLIGDYS